jgi:sigma-B regulation protein RsbU (phosphoserine phosphatase)
MPRFTEWPRPVLLVLAVLVAAASIAYGVVWMIYARGSSQSPQPIAERIALELVFFFPVLFLVVGISVLFLRLRDRNAWVLTLLFAGFITGGPITAFEEKIPDGLRAFALCYAFIFSGLFPATSYYFFAVFPAASPLDRRVPWLKNLLLALALGVSLSLGVWVLAAQSSRPLQDWFSGLVGHWNTPILVTLSVAGFALGLTSLVLNSLRNPVPEARRKSRVMVWGMVAGLTPFSLLLLASTAFAHRPYYELPYWVWTPCVIALFLVPLSFAYAVLKYRVMEIPILLKRTARFALVRGVFIFAVVVLSLWLPWRLAGLASYVIGADTQATLPLAILLGTAFGMIWVVGATHLERWLQPHIDRRFFRSVYDARQILEELAERARSVSSREQLAFLLRQRVQQALHPKSLAIYFQETDGNLQLQGDTVNLPASLDPNSPLLAELVRHGRPWEFPASDEPFPAWSHSPVNLPQLASLRALLEQEMGHAVDPSEITDVMQALAPAAPECLVPLVGRDARLVGLIVLGERLSEEPYSGEDQRLLASVAGQAAIALDNLRLAETMAQKLEAERRTANELSIAREVQSKLFPQKSPPLATLEYAGSCDQARTIGGDYYDFLNLGPGRVGLVLADISGKGIFAALLMANLQANLRGQYALALTDLRGLLRSVNSLFFESVTLGLYATMFFGDYSDQTRTLRYVNCGHNAPLLLRADGRSERLEATATVVGLIEEWDCTVAHVTLAPGDVLVIYSDGATEAADDHGDFFGEARLLETLRACRHLPAAEAMRAINRAVHRFSGKDQEDDLTLLVARAR